VRLTTRMLDFMARPAKKLHIVQILVKEAFVSFVVNSEILCGRAALTGVVSVSADKFAERFPARGFQVGFILLLPALLGDPTFSSMALALLFLGGLAQDSDNVTPEVTTRVLQRDLANPFNVHSEPSEGEFLRIRVGEEASHCLSRWLERSRQGRFLKFPVWVPSSAPAHCRTRRFLCLSGLQPLQPRPSVSPTVHALAEPRVACYYPDGARVDSPLTTGADVLEPVSHTDIGLSSFGPPRLSPKKFNNNACRNVCQELR
jgi:hypothetical protein